MMDKSKEYCISAAFRAMSHSKLACVTFKERANNLENLSSSLFAMSGNNLTVSLKEIDSLNISFVRGIADGEALKLFYHDKDLHDTLLVDFPKDKLARYIFKSAEQARVESLGAVSMQGVAHNISVKWEEYFDIYSEPGVEDVIAALIRKELSGISIPHSLSEKVKNWQDLLGDVLEKYISQLKNYIRNQEEFARTVSSMVQDFQFLSSDSRQEEDPVSVEKQVQTDVKMLQENGKVKDGKTQSYTTKDAVKNYKDDQQQSDQGYAVYTKEFDQVILADSLYTNDEIIRLRKQLDSKLLNLKEATVREAGKFLRKIMARQNRYWDYNLESGTIDSKKFPQLIADPGYFEYYKSEYENKNNHTIVSILLDNSGSMRGKPIMIAAMCAEILSRVLESCQIKVEILGFTTVEWKGGKSRAQWLKQGSQTNPGRLNDLRHIIYKSAEMPWRKAKKNIALMLKEGILKENIDGEAVSWASSRLLARPEKRKILMVISDGAPVDDSTISANYPSYLDKHLRKVIKTIEDKTSIELVAIGIGHDVTRYYGNAVIIRDVEHLGKAMFNQLAELF